MLPSLLFVGNLTMAFIFTSLPLSFSTSVSGCGCGFGFEQQYWWIDEFGEKTDRQILKDTKASDKSMKFTNTLMK